MNSFVKSKNSKKIHVALLFGGRSAEHEVSVMSARNIFLALDKQQYDVTPIGIDQNGAWSYYNKQQLFSHSKVILGKRLRQSTGIDFYSKKIDVVFPVLHGPFGEDGSIQGLLKLANVPFVGAGVLGSAVGMDKDVMKRLLREAGLPINRFLVLNEYEKSRAHFEKIRRTIGLPFFVKPANLGSSVGISKVHTKSEFLPAIKKSFTYDSKILVEEFIRGKEVECAVLGNEKPIVSVCGEVIPSHEFYSYEAKYLDEHGAMLRIPARIPTATARKICNLAMSAFRVLGCQGMARVDFFLTKRGKIYLNEINTIPGFTAISMYPKLWEATGMAKPQLVSKLIDLAMTRFKNEQKLRTTSGEVTSDKN